MPPPIPFPDLVIPGISSGINYCIFRVDRSFDGVYNGGQSAASYDCTNGPVVKNTSRFSASITWRITSPLACDEVSEVWPSTQLTAKGITVVRADAFAHFLGTFSIVRKRPPEPDIPFFKGTLELIGRIGSHQTLAESCDAEDHIEGWLVGRGQRAMRKYTLRAVIVAHGKLTGGTHAFPNASVNRMEGTLLKSP